MVLKIVAMIICFSELMPQTQEAVWWRRVIGRNSPSCALPNRGALPHLHPRNGVMSREAPALCQQVPIPKKLVVFAGEGVSAEDFPIPFGLHHYDQVHEFMRYVTGGPMSGNHLAEDMEQTQLVDVY
jgi:hypothetical protein